MIGGITNKTNIIAPTFSKEFSHYSETSIFLASTSN